MRRRPLFRWITVNSPNNKVVAGRDLTSVLTSPFLLNDTKLVHLEWCYGALRLVILYEHIAQEKRGLGGPSRGGCYAQMQTIWTHLLMVKTTFCASAVCNVDSIYYLKLFSWLHLSTNERVVGIIMVHLQQVMLFATSSCIAKPK
jgi:hypothetical protein